MLVINTRRAIVRSVALLAAASLAAACANPTGPADLNARTGATGAVNSNSGTIVGSSSGTIVGSSSSATPTSAARANGTIVGSSS